MIQDIIQAYLPQLTDSDFLGEIVEQTTNATKVFNIKLINWDDFFELIIRFVFNAAIILIIARGIYYPITKRKDYLFSYLLIGLIVFLLCFTLSSVKLQLGFALGLFAIFGILRYRTDTIPIKEMTYLFIVIGISVINALTNKKVSYAELLFVNLVVLFALYALEYLWLLRHETVKKVVYEKIELIKQNRHQELKKDLEERTGLIISRIEVGKIDFLRDSAQLNVYYFQSAQINRADQESEFEQNNDDDD